MYSDASKMLKWVHVALPTLSNTGHVKNERYDRMKRHIVAQLKICVPFSN